MFQFPGFPSYTYGFSAWWQEFFLPGSPIQTSAAQWIFAPPRGFSQLITSFVGSQCQGIRPVPYLAWPFVPTSCSVMMRSVLFLRFLLKSVNLFFSMIYGLMCFWYAVFKVHSYEHLDNVYLRAMNIHGIRTHPPGLTLISLSLTCYLSAMSFYLYLKPSLRSFFSFGLAATCSPVPSPAKYHRPLKS